jgi:hypothetical protein
MSSWSWMCNTFGEIMNGNWKKSYNFQSKRGITLLKIIKPWPNSNLTCIFLWHIHRPNWSWMCATVTKTMNGNWWWRNDRVTEWRNRVTLYALGIIWRRPEQSVYIAVFKVKVKTNTEQNSEKIFCTDSFPANDNHY